MADQTSADVHMYCCVQFLMSSILTVSVHEPAVLSTLLVFQYKIINRMSKDTKVEILHLRHKGVKNIDVGID